MVKFLLFFVILLAFFHGAFQTYIFKDDFYLFSISRVTSWDQFWQFFAPFKAYGFYRPLATEVFYFLAGVVNNLFLTRLVVFAVFALGLVLLEKTVFFLTKQRGLALLVVIMYAVNFSHVFQLYWLATFQEVAMFTLSLLTTYLFFKKRLFWSLLTFMAALLCREEAMLLPFLLGLLTLTKLGLRNKPYLQNLMLLFLLAVPFFLLYRVNFALVSVRPEYTPHYSPLLVGNNVLWYGFWALGLPSFLSDYLPTVLSLPTSGFWVVVQNLGALPYLLVLTGYLITLLVATLLALDKKTVKVIGFGLLAFLIYVLPMSVIVHRWMVRLTIPLIFIVFLQATIISRTKKPLALFLILTYVLYNLLAVPVHQISSTYILESRIAKTVGEIIGKNKQKIVNQGTVYFADSRPSSNGWEGSQKLKVTLSDQWFLKYYLPEANVKAVYGFEQAAAPAGSFVVDSQFILSSPAQRQ